MARGQLPAAAMNIILSFFSFLLLSVHPRTVKMTSLWLLPDVFIFCFKSIAPKSYPVNVFTCSVFQAQPLPCVGLGWVSFSSVQLFRASFAGSTHGCITYKTQQTEEKKISQSITEQETCEQNGRAGYSLGSSSAVKRRTVWNPCWRADSNRSMEKWHDKDLHCDSPKRVWPTAQQIRPQEPTPTLPPPRPLPPSSRSGTT